MDIAKRLLDQSLAVQLLVEDGENEQAALGRGLEQELGLYGIRPEKVAGPVKIVKTYDYDPKLLNREFVSLYRVTLRKKPKLDTSSWKIDDLFWMDMEQVRKLIQQRPQMFTKTFRMWFNMGLV